MDELKAEMGHLERLQQAAWSAAIIECDLLSIDVVLKVLTARAKALGLKPGRS